MPSPLVNRYAIYFHLPDQGKVPQTIGREPSLLMAVESCLMSYQATGHTGFVIEDPRKRREFQIERDLLLRLIFLRHHDRTRYFEILNRLDREGNQKELVSFLAAHAQM
ncbi:MAG TPA: hypothetical protein VGA48_00050 [Thermoplasmata archaeon]